MVTRADYWGGWQQQTAPVGIEYWRAGLSARS